MQGSHNLVTSDRCIEVETVLFSLPAIVAFELKIFYLCDRSDPCEGQITSQNSVRDFYDFEIT